jgi:hypothetical protein
LHFYVLIYKKYILASKSDKLPPPSKFTTLTSIHHYSGGERKGKKKKGILLYLAFFLNVSNHSANSAEYKYYPNERSIYLHGKVGP